MNFPTDELMSVEEIRTLETLISINGCSMFELMHRAGVASAEHTREAFPDTQHVIIFCGKGNNGGDGWVAARYLASQQIRVTLITPSMEQITAEPVRTHAQIVMDDIDAGKLATLSHLINPSSEDLNALSETLNTPTVIIDAILGIGFRGETLREPFNTWVQWMNERGKREGVDVLALDIPSGLHADEKTCACDTVYAQKTITMLAKKQAFVPENLPYTGEVTCATLLTPGEISRLKKVLSAQSL